MARFSNYKQFPFGEYSLGGLIGLRSVIGSWRNAVLKLQTVAVQHLESVINQRTLSVTSAVVLTETSSWSIVSWTQFLTHSRHLTLVAVFLCLIQVQSSALLMSSWEQFSIGISSYASNCFIDPISVSIPSMTSCFSELSFDVIQVGFNKFQFLSEFFSVLVSRYWKHFHRQWRRNSHLLAVFEVPKPFVL